MKKLAGKAYSGIIKSVLKGVNPLKKKIVDTPCLVHLMINNGAVDELISLGHSDEYRVFNTYRDALNDGVVWADQDFKSINHFFHHEKKRGLFGFQDAHILFRNYYDTACKEARLGNMAKAMFYLGAALHLLQDSTVPHHVLNRLAMNHRKFEVWIIKNYAKKNAVFHTKEAIHYEDVDSYVLNNVEFSYKTYVDSKKIDDKEARYHYIGRRIIKRSQSSTAGLLIKFYRDNL